MNLTIKESIHIFENSQIKSDNFTANGIHGAYIMALGALYKQLPAKPSPSDTDSYYVCPNCDHFIERNERTHGNIDIPYCKWCGQALDWSEND